MYSFRCKDCHGISYSASSDTRAPCLYCGIGPVTRLDEIPVEDPTTGAASPPRPAARCPAGVPKAVR